MTSNFCQLPWAVILEKLWELDSADTGSSNLREQCQRAAFVASVCCEWHAIVKGALNKCQSALHLIARNEFGGSLADGWGLPRTKIVDSLQKSIFIETLADRAAPLARDSLNLSWAVNFLSTSGSSLVMAVSTSRRETNDGGEAPTADCWLGRDSEPIKYGIAVLCLLQTSITAYMPYPARVNAIHLSVSGLLFTADQAGRLQIRSREGDGQASGEEEEEGRGEAWGVVEEWRTEAGDAIQCMAVREENPSQCEYQVALLCYSGVCVLRRLEGHLNLVCRLPPDGGQWRVPQQLVCLTDNVAQLLFSGPTSLRFSDGFEEWTWDLNSTPPRPSARWQMLPALQPAAAPAFDAHDIAVPDPNEHTFQADLDVEMADDGDNANANNHGANLGPPPPPGEDGHEQRCRLVPRGLLVWTLTSVTLFGPDGQQVVWSRAYRGVVQAFADESLLFLVRPEGLHAYLSVVNVRCPPPSLLNSPGARLLVHKYSLERSIGLGVYPASTVRCCASGNVIAFVECAHQSACLQIWYATGSRGWAAVERAHYKAALRDDIRPHPLLAKAALDYLCLCLAAELNPAHLCELYPSTDPGAPSPSTPAAAVTLHTSESLQVEVLRSRRSCGRKQGASLVSMLVMNAQNLRTLCKTHEEAGFWRDRFAVSSAAADELAAAARDCRQHGPLLLQLPGIHRLLLRHLRLSLHPPYVSSFFGPLVANTYPDPVEIDALGRGQGKMAAVKEWMRRWRSDIRMLQGEKEALAAQLDELLAVYKQKDP